MLNRRLIFCLLGLTLGAATQPLLAAEVPVVLSADASSCVQLAAQDLVQVLGHLYPQDRFRVATNLPAVGKAIILGQASDAAIRTCLSVPTTPESFLIRSQTNAGLALGIIAGADGRGAAFGVYHLLFQLGCGFYLSGDTLPAPKTGTFDFAGWQMEDAPLVRERLVFDWHNFLSGCSTWNFSEWQKWIAQSQKMGFNAIMVHAYGNNPMAEFSFEGAAKPIGYLSTTIKGRDWSTMHVNDVRRIFGGEVFHEAAFGADAGLAPEDQRAAAAQSLMRDVFGEAARHEMGIYFAVDVDTPSANPQELVRRLPASARFEAKGLWLPNPDTPEGYAFFRAEVAGLLQEYPQITRLVAWFRRGGTVWMDLKTADLPPAWQQELAAEVGRTPEAGRFWHAPGLFAVGKIVRAFERALQEVGATQTHLAAGSWGFEFLSAADRYFPAGVPLLGLDYDVIREKPQLRDAALREPLRLIGARRPVIPIVWAQHDDGHYIGRPYTPLPEFAAKLDDAKAAGFGIIHWTTRPTDLYFESLAQQVWKSTKDQPLPETCRQYAERCFGADNRAVMGGYFAAWINDAPQFGRETSDRFIDRKFTNITEVVAGCRARLALLAQAHPAGFTPEQQRRFDYQRGLEEFIASFYEAQGCYQDSQTLLGQDDIAGARNRMGQCHPEKVIEKFAHLSSLGGITRGEQGLIVTLNTRWLSHIVSHRQALGLEPVRVNFAATSHDLLAQSPGAYTFHFGPDHEFWETWGEKETGAAVASLPPSPPIARNASLPVSWNEVGRCGIEIAKPVTLTLGPIMATDNRGREKSLSAGDYHLHLLAIDPLSTAAEQRGLTVKVADLPADLVDVFHRAGERNRVVDLVYSVALKSAGTVAVTLTPVKGQAILCAAVLEPRNSEAGVQVK